MIYHKPRFFAWTDTETTGLENFDEPIEIAIIVTDEALKEQLRFESLMRPPRLERFVQKVGDEMRWFPKLGNDASDVHKIDAKEVVHAQHMNVILNRVARLMQQFSVDTLPIMVSDNPVFEWLMLARAFDRAGIHWPFHYNIWSPVMLTSAFGMKPPHKPHRAMGDVEAMLDHTREALSLVESIPEPVPDFSKLESFTKAHSVAFLDQSGREEIVRSVSMNPEVAYLTEPREKISIDSSEIADFTEMTDLLKPGSEPDPDDR